jgi:ABC-type nitrate/sulfonate/bicarbonate transport system substrate-binding protein
LVVVAACGGGGGGKRSATVSRTTEVPPSTPVKIRMGWALPGEEIKYVMMAKPEIAKNSGIWYTLEWSQVANTTAGVQGLMAGTLDAASVGGASAATGIEQGLDIVFTGEFIEERPSNFSTTWLVKADSPIKAPADVKGRVLGNSGGISDLVAKAKLRDAGLEPGRDYTVQQVSFSKMKDALSSGAIDVGNFPQPFYAMAKATGGFRDLFRMTDVQPELVLVLQGFRRDFVTQQPAAVRKFLEDWVAASRYVRDRTNRETVIDATAAATKLPKTTLETFLLSSGDYFRPVNGAVNVAGLQRTWDFLRSQGGIKTDLKVAPYVVDEFLPPKR